MKILHCSDIHLGRRPQGAVGEFATKRFEDYFTAFEYVIEYAIVAEIDVFIVAGDLFDKPSISPDILARTENLFGILKAAGIAVIVIEGNHDDITFGNEKNSWIEYLAGKGLLRRPTYQITDDGYDFVPVIIDGLAFFGLGHPRAFTKEVVEGFVEYLSRNKCEKCVAIIHTAIGNEEFLQGFTSKEVIDKLSGYVLYAAGGHAHGFSAYPSQKPFFFVPGSLECWDMNESTQQKGFIIFDTDTQEFKHIPSKFRRVHNIKAVFDGDNEYDLYDYVKKLVIQEKITAGEDLLVFNIVLKHDILFDYNKLEDLVNNCNPLKAFINISYINGTAEPAANRSMQTIRQIEEEIISKWQYFSSDVERTADLLDSLKTMVRNEQTEDFADTFDSFLESFIQSTEARL
jgi:DNA repair exonuclease SbcCD nuclease subunit